MSESQFHAETETRETEIDTADVPDHALENEADVADLQAQIEDLQAQLADIDKYHQADLQNLHRRHQEELQATHKFAARNFAQELLKVKDYLEMALLDKSENFAALKMGVEMTLTELSRAFSQAQIQEILPQTGDMLDPHRHQAFQAEASDLPPNSIVRVMQKGYTLHERVLRPATVVVAKADAADEAASD